MRGTTRRAVTYLKWLAVAAVALWWDTRAFLFVGFLLLLSIYHRLDRLRAIVRVFHFNVETRLEGVLARLGAGTPDEIEAMLAERLDARLNAMPYVTHLDIADDVDLAERGF